MKTFVIIPTYNEAENIKDLVDEIFKQEIPDVSVVIVDDNSPDGTGKIADELAKREDRVKVLHRVENRGRGSAGIEGFKFALQEGADYIVEMDADLSHDPRYIIDMLLAIEDFDVVIGSRFVKGGKDADRNITRRAVTAFARKYIQTMLRLKVKDVTSGFRCFRKKVLEEINLDSLVSSGPSIVEEILHRAAQKGFKIKEIPIVFHDRKKGKTKLNFGILLKTLKMIPGFRKKKPE